MAHLNLIYLPNRLLLATGPRHMLLEHNHFWYIPWASINPELLWHVEQQHNKAFYWQHGLIEQGCLKSRSGSKKSPDLMRGLLPNPFFPLSWNRLIIPRKLQGLMLEEFSPASEEVPRGLSWLEHELRGSPGDQRINHLISNEFELLDHRPEDQSSLYKHFKNGRLFQLLTLPIEKIGNNDFEAEWVFSEITHPQWAYNFLRQRERKKRGHNDLMPQEYLQMLEIDPSGKTCQQSGCNEPRIKHSSLCKNHHFEAVMGMPPEQS